MEFSEGCLRLLATANAFNREATRHGRCFPFTVAGEQVGLVPEKVADELRSYPEVFTREATPCGEETVYLHPRLQDYSSRSDAIATILEDLRERKIFLTLDGWRNECYDVCGSDLKKPLLKMERAATPLFGTKQYGVHINGFTIHPSKGMCMWIAKRAMTKQTFPGKLDQMVAGGLSSGLGVHECAIKESHEEASVPDNILENLVPVSCISYFFESVRGLYPESQYIFDLEVPPDFTPVNADGEAESFQLLTIDELKKVVISGEFKFNCSVVIVDFFVRHGIITPDTDPNYLKLVIGLRTPHPY